jgi:ATP-dependent DNA helicase RecG
MNITLQQLDQWLRAKENEHLEFKEAKQNFHFEKLVKYCAALANEGGGSIILVVSDTRPRKVVGSQAFADLERTKAGLIEKLRLRIEADELQHPQGRVLVFTAPARPIGMPVAVDGAYYMRAGEDLAAMTPDMLRRIFDESGPDFSAEVCPQATPADLDPPAIEALRTRWMERSQNKALAKRTPQKLVQDAELVTAEGVTYAALILLGTRKALGQHLAQSEIIFEYRSSEAPGPANQRDEYRQGFFTYYDKLWETVNLRNDRQHYQDGLVMHPVPTFSEGAVREAFLNAVSHRDYRHPGSVFIRQYARRIEIVSPGGFPPGITAENILDQQLPRNRRIAETFARCGLVERAGQGADRMLEECVRQGKRLPDYNRSDTHQVWLTLYGEIGDEEFLRYMNRIGEEKLAQLDPHDYLILGLVAAGEKPAAELAPRIPHLLELGVLQRTGRGKVILSSKLYQRATTIRAEARKKDEERERNKIRLLRIIVDRRQIGVSLTEAMAEIPELSRNQVQTLLRQLRKEGKARPLGSTKGARWYPAPTAGIADENRQ